MTPAHDHPSQLTQRRIAVILGDGIGREVMPVAVAAVRAAARDDVAIEFVEFPWSCDFYRETGAIMPRRPRSAHDGPHADMM